MVGDYISRDEMIEQTKARVILGAPEFNTGLKAAIEVAASIPAADVVEVVWRTAEKPPELGRPEQMEPDLVVRQSPPVLVIHDGFMEIATYIEETDPTDPDYRRLYWLNDLDCAVKPDYWTVLPEPPMPLRS